MAHSPSQENPDGVVVRDSYSEQLPHNARSSNNLHIATRPSTSKPSTNNNIDEDTTVGPLLRRFLLSLNAKEVVGPRGCHTFVLQPGEYAKASKSLPESDPEVWGYVENKLRHDLINGKYLIVKMPTTIHEMVSGMIADSIRKQLAAIEETSNEPTKRLIQSIESIASGRINFNGVNGHREPDQQFAIEGSYYPGIVIELAYSQSFKSLRRKAGDFIVDSDGDIQLVIGLETESKKPYKISAWRPDFTRPENTVAMKAITEQDTIRDENGKIKPGSMTFRLQDFGMNLATTYPDADLTKTITLHYIDLAGYLAKAENRQNLQRPPRRNLIRMRSSSPEEKLGSEDEGEFRRRENMSFARSEAEDSDYSDPEAA